MMLRTDMALVEDAKFLPFVQNYAADEELFKKDFSAAFGKLMALGCPSHCQPTEERADDISTINSNKAKAFREHAMHGSLERMKEIVLANSDTNLAIYFGSKETPSQ